MAKVFLGENGSVRLSDVCPKYSLARKACLANTYGVHTFPHSIMTHTGHKKEVKKGEEKLHEKLKNGTLAHMCYSLCFFAMLSLVSCPLPDIRINELASLSTSCHLCLPVKGTCMSSMSRRNPRPIPDLNQRARNCYRYC